ncbi:MAG TPA: response regulator transcription factor [Streptosporangiaceae bacterium]|nr:response regulator transcription factor [Streptosporangiaceae bacterium]
MSNVLVLTASRESAAEILPSLSLLDHAITVAPPSGDAVLRAIGTAGLPDVATPDAVLVDARRDLVRVKELLRHVAGAGTPVLTVISEGAWAAVSADWGTDDVILNTAGPGEVEARIRLAIGRAAAQQGPAAEEVRSGELVIDEGTYSARIRGAALDLTFKEFELLKFLAQHPRRVFGRAQLLQEVWGYDYFGGTRTVDVHVRRLRAKLGPEHEALIGTVRNVGYKFVPAKHEGRKPEPASPAGRGGAGAAVRRRDAVRVARRAALARGNDGVSR